MKILSISFLMLSFLLYGCSAPVVTSVVNTMDISAIDMYKPAKSGEDCGTFIPIFYYPTVGEVYISYGSRDIAKAVKNGDMSKVYYVAYEGNCLVVFGE